MDITSTASAIAAAPAAAASTSWVQLLIAALFGWALPKAIAKDPNIGAQVKSAAGEAVKLAPDAAAVATLAGQPALAGGIEAASKVITAITTTTNPAQLAALVAAHAQTLAAAGAPPAPAPATPGV